MKTSVERGNELMKTPGKDIPKLATQYAKFLADKYMPCGELYLTAFAHYAELIEGLSCSDDLYKADDQAKLFFATISA